MGGQKTIESGREREQTLEGKYDGGNGWNGRAATEKRAVTEYLMSATITRALLKFMRCQCTTRRTSDRGDSFSAPEETDGRREFRGQKCIGVPSKGYGEQIYDVRRGMTELLQQIDCPLPVPPIESQKCSSLESDESTRSHNLKPSHAFARMTDKMPDINQL